MSNFDKHFEALSGNLPFPWQQALYEKFIAGEIPSACDIPTGLGKTSVVAVWLIALAYHPEKMPRRLVYVVNRRTVVDQTTNEVEKLRKNLSEKAELAELRKKLGELALSTLRGQFADNREWSADPARPAVIVGTVDMIGSRLLFSGYGCGFKTKPLHAGFLGQDVLLVHDEAHLEPAFQKLLTAIRDEQKRCKEYGKFHLMEMSATGRGDEKSFTLTDQEMNSPSTIPTPPTEPIHYVWQRLNAKKGILFEHAKRSELPKKIGEMALRWKTLDKAVLIFVRTIDDVKTVEEVLTDKKSGVPTAQVQLLTGTMRGLERDGMVEKEIFKRFQLKSKSDGKTVYLVCTSAGEVGIDISADHMVCDLATLDSMAQRLGRVNRRGGGEAEIDVVYESDPNPKAPSPALEEARRHTKAILEQLPQCDWIQARKEASPRELGGLMRKLTEEERKAAFAPEPDMLETSDILFDAWALTSIRGRLPGRPPVEKYLHGVSGWEPPETRVAWREEVAELNTPELREQYKPEDLLEDYPLKPHELLRDRSDRVHERLKKLKAPPDTPVWLLSEDDSEDDKVQVMTLGAIVEGDKEYLKSKTVLLPPSAGGLRQGLLTSDSDAADDVSDRWYEDKEQLVKRRVRLWDNDAAPQDMRLIRPPIRIKLETDKADEDDDANVRSWYWYELSKAADGDGSKSSKQPIGWKHHTDDVVENAKAIVEALKLPEELRKAIVTAAEFHDLGKRREKWQRGIGNLKYPDEVYAKSGGKMKARELGDSYRHEFGSLVDVLSEHDVQVLQLKALSADMRELVLHLIAVHHGHGRPHFPAEYVFDSEAQGANVGDIAAQVPLRYARLQRKYGRWGLAYLESLLRAADYKASAKPTPRPEEK